MSTRIGVYAASLDPITNGHVNIIERAAALCDQLYIIVAVNSGKRPLFSPTERAEMATAAIPHVHNATVIVRQDGYVAKHAAELGARVIYRGIRDFSDMTFEQVFAHESQRIEPSVDISWLPCRHDLAMVSSSLVKSHVGIDPGWPQTIAPLVPDLVVTMLQYKQTLKQASQHWHYLMGLIGQPSSGQMIFEDLVARYSEPHRYYHTLAHIIEMLDELMSLNPVSQANVPLHLAVWLHDAIYNPRNKTRNEAKSAELALEHIAVLELSDEVGQEVERLILATQHRSLPPDDATGLISDLDLCGMAAPWPAFVERLEQLRKEFGDASASTFNGNQARLLQHFLDRPHVFVTERFRQRYEAAAQENLKRAVTELKAAAA